MQAQPQERPGLHRRRWGVGVLVACVGLVGLVAVAAEGAPLKGPLTSEEARLGDGWVVAALVIAMALGLAALVVFLVALSGQRSASGAPPRRRRGFIRSLLLMAGLLLLSLALGPLGERARVEPPLDPVGAAPIDLPDTGPRRSTPVWPVLVLGSVVLLGLVGASVATRRARPEPSPAAVEGPDLDVAAGAFTDSMASLLGHPDPRTAIRAAYAGLLDGLAACGLGRRRSEAPHEHLRRALGALAVRPAPMEELVVLYDEARFSEHTLTDADRTRALHAFEAARHDLARVEIS